MGRWVWTRGGGGCGVCLDPTSPCVWLQQPKVRRDCRGLRGGGCSYSIPTRVWDSATLLGAPLSTSSSSTQPTPYRHLITKSEAGSVSGNLWSVLPVLAPSARAQRSLASSPRAPVKQRWEEGVTFVIPLSAWRLRY